MVMTMVMVMGSIMIELQYDTEKNIVFDSSERLGLPSWLVTFDLTLPFSFSAISRSA